MCAPMPGGLTFLHVRVVRSRAEGAHRCAAGAPPLEPARLFDPRSKTGPVGGVLGSLPPPTGPLGSEQCRSLWRLGVAGYPRNARAGFTAWGVARVGKGAGWQAPARGRLLPAPPSQRYAQRLGGCRRCRYEPCDAPPAGGFLGPAARRTPPVLRRDEPSAQRFWPGKRAGPHSRGYRNPGGDDRYVATPAAMRRG